MNNKQQTLPCPICSTPVIFDTYQLLQGVKFSCPKCYAAIGLAEDSMGTVQSAMNQFEKMKSEINKPSSEKPNF